MMIHIEPLGTEVILPAIVIGYELPSVGTNPDTLSNLPGWIVTLDQQAGGLGMSYPSVIGVVLRLEANRSKGKKDLAHLIRGLKFMAEDPNKAMLTKEYPVLRKLVATWGTEYKATELRDLQKVLASSLRIPTLKSGIEAFIRCAPCDPLDYFEDWKMMSCRIREGDGHRGSVYATDQEHCYYVDDSNLADLTVIDEDEFNGDTMDFLKGIAQDCFTGAEPSVFFLWENSD